MATEVPAMRNVQRGRLCVRNLTGFGANYGPLCPLPLSQYFGAQQNAAPLEVLAVRGPFVKNVENNAKTKTELILKH